MVCGTPGCGGALGGWAPDGRSTSGRSDPLIGGANTVAGTGTDGLSPESFTVLPAQLSSAARAAGRRKSTPGFAFGAA
nr:hypothetical protein [Actinacidiphila yeochonensis]